MKGSILILNTNQKQLVNENHNLIYYILQKRHKTTDDVEDWYGVAATALCKAATNFNPEIGCKFTTYACTAMHRAISNVERKQRVQTISLTEKLSQSQCFPSSNNMCEIIEQKMIMQSVLSRQTDRNKQIICLVMDGYSQRIVAQKYHLSRQTICNIYNAFIKECVAELGGDD